MKRFACLLLCAVIIIILSQPEAAASPASNPPLRIGLNCNSAGAASTLVAANLQNFIGSGYEFGYMDTSMEFVPLGSTSETRITILPNRNIYLSGGSYSTTQSDIAVGAFHNTHGAFGSRHDAEAAAEALRSQGTQAFVSYQNGEFLVRSGSFISSSDGRVTGSNRCITVVATGTTNILFQFDHGDTFHLAVRPVNNTEERAQTWHRQRRYNGIFEFRRIDGGHEITVISIVDMQDYIKGVVPYEMSPSWPLEALKAQAVSAKSFAAGSLNRHRSHGYNLCDTTHCQVYRGTSSASANSDRAVDETYGIYMMHNGNVCTSIYYFSSSGGATEDSENVWTLAIPYLRGVADPYENPSQIPGYQWSYTVTNAQLSAYLSNNLNIVNNGVTGFYIDRTTRMGNVRSVTVLGGNGQPILTRTGDNARIFIAGLLRTVAGAPNTYAFSLRYGIFSGGHRLTAVTSDGLTANHDAGAIGGLYAIDGNGNKVLLPPASSVQLIGQGGLLYGIPAEPSAGSTTGVYTVSGRGHGHNVGMSQWGARGMADLDYSFDAILRHYFTGVEIVSFD
jgi:stage II sporulation protein D